MERHTHFLALVHQFIVGILTARELEDAVVDAACLEVGEGDGGPEDADLDAQALGIIVAWCEQGLYLLHLALHAMLGSEGDEQGIGAVGILGDGVGVVVGLELEHLQLLVLLVHPGVMQLYDALLLAQDVLLLAVVPHAGVLVDRLGLVALVPRRALLFVESEDVDLVGKTHTLLSLEVVVGCGEDTLGLTGIGRVLRYGSE